MPWKVRNWCTLAATRSSGGAAQTKPIFQPVSEKILPAEPTLMVRSRMPGMVISGMCLCSSKVTCSQTSSQIAMTSNSWQ